MKRYVSSGRRLHKNVEVPEADNVEEVAYHHTTALSHRGRSPRYQ
jgi:hypothetical protein